VSAHTKSLRTHGVDLSYALEGHGAPLVCIQGVGVCGTGWRPQVERLASGFQTICVDNRGIGSSAPGPRPLTVAAMASDVVAIMDAEGLERVHLMGHSLGGLIALQVALSVPTRIKSLSLLCTFANGADATRLSLRMLSLGLRTRIGTRRMRRNAMLDMIMPEAFLRGTDRDRLASDLQALFGRDLADQPPIIGRQLGAMSRHNVTARLHELSGLPTLVVSATHDPIAPPRLGRSIADRIAGARFVEFPHASHALPIQCADEINRLLLEHLMTAEGL
jgi:pimeloyl-ACP methyl ester carboxylesterase